MVDKKVSTHVAGLDKLTLSVAVHGVPEMVKKYPQWAGFIYLGDGHVYLTDKSYIVRWDTPELLDSLGSRKAVALMEDVKPLMKGLRGKKKLLWADFPWTASGSAVLPDLGEAFKGGVVESAGGSPLPMFAGVYLSLVLELVRGESTQREWGCGVSLLPQADATRSEVPWRVFCSETDVVASIVPLSGTEGVARSASASAPVAELALFPESEPESAPVSESESESAPVEPLPVTAEFPTVQTESETGDVVAVPEPTAPSVSVDVVKAVIPVGVNTCPEFDSISDGTVYRFGRLHHRVAYVKVSDDRSRVVVAHKAGYVAGSDTVGEARLNSLLDSLGVVL